MLLLCSIDTACSFVEENVIYYCKGANTRCSLCRNEHASRRSNIYAEICGVNLYSFFRQVTEVKLGQVRSNSGWVTSEA